MERASLKGEINLSAELKTAWETALGLYGCVDCARLDLIHRLNLMAFAKGQEIMGPQGDAPPRRIGPDGIRLTCDLCEAEAAAAGEARPLGPGGMDDDIAF